MPKKIVNGKVVHLPYGNKGNSKGGNKPKGGKKQ